MSQGVANISSEFGVDVPEHSILSRLGRGGMAAVYLAREERLGRLVAVKVIDERFERDPHFRRRFEREARTAASLTHPHIVPVYQYGFTADDRPYLSMAFMEDGSLRDRLRKHCNLPVLEALGITRQIASALQAAHSRNLVHRDLKPDNVLFQGDTAMLTDFGITKVLDASTALTGTGTNPGSVRYFSPEQASEKPLDQRSDIYTLGVVLYELLTGHLPITGNSVVQTMMRIVHQLPEALPPDMRGLQPLLNVMLAKDPSARFASCADVISVIQAMERNWTRFGELDRITHGIDLGSGDECTDGDAASATHGPTMLLPAVAAASNVHETRDSAFADDTGSSKLVVYPYKDEHPSYLRRVGIDHPVRTSLAACMLLAGAGWLWLHSETQHAGTTGASASTAAAAHAAPTPGPRHYLDTPRASVHAPLAPKHVALAARGHGHHVHEVPAAMTDGTVRIDAEPADAHITLPELGIVYSADMHVPAGDLRVRVQHEGYYEQALTLHIPAGMKNGFRVVLQPIGTGMVAPHHRELATRDAPT